MAAPQIDHPILSELADAHGAAVAVQFLGALKGQRLYIPKTRAQPRILALLGAEIAEWVRVTWGGGFIDVPSNGGFMTTMAGERRGFVQANRDMNVNDIAARLGITHRRVLQIRREIDQGGRT